MYVITTRPPNQKERQVLEWQKRPDAASYGCLTLFFGVVPVFFLGKLGAWMGGFASAPAVTYGRWAGWVLGLVILGWVLVTFIPYERRQRIRGRKDADEQLVEEITVSQPRVYEIGAESDNEPILTFDIGEGKILFLQGQWLRDEVTYGAPRQEGDRYEEFVNGLQKPFSFPSSAFTVSRWPHSGRVLGINVQGDYVAPEKMVTALRREYEFGDSELFDGALDDIAAVLAREHAKRLGALKL